MIKIICDISDYLNIKYISMAYKNLFLKKCMILSYKTSNFCVIIGVIKGVKDGVNYPEFLYSSILYQRI